MSPSQHSEKEGDWRTRWLWPGLGAAVGVARVFVGVHYPKDVLAGAMLGGLWDSLALASAPWLERLDCAILECLAY